MCNYTIATGSKTLSKARRVLSNIDSVAYEIRRIVRHEGETFEEARRKAIRLIKKWGRGSWSALACGTLPDDIRFCFPEFNDVGVKALVNMAKNRHEKESKLPTCPFFRSDMDMLVITRLNAFPLRKTPRARRSPARSAAKSGGDGGSGEDGDSDQGEPPGPLNAWTVDILHRLLLDGRCVR